LPPSAGFLAKLWLLQGLPVQAPGWWMGLILLAALLSMLALARAGSALFWQEMRGSWLPARPGTLLPLSALSLMALALALFAEPLSAYCQRMAEQLLLTSSYIEVLR
jgi:multicomponent K+:H+ antiporter subunit D